MAMAICDLVTFPDALHELAGLHGVSTTYQGNDKRTVNVSQHTLLATLHALGVNTGTGEEGLRAAIEAFHDAEASRPLPHCVVATAGYPYVFPVHVPDGTPAEITLELEDGGIVHPRQVENWNPPRTVGEITWGEASFELPNNLPLGWHRLTLSSSAGPAEATVVVAPERISSAEHYLNHPAYGVMAQLYSVRSANSWGIGDFRDLAELARVTAAGGAQFLLTNPLHAAEPFPPVEDSPYLPTTRRFVHPIYLRIEDVPEYQLLDDETRAGIAELAAPHRAANRSAEQIKRNPLYTAKLAALRELFAHRNDPGFGEFIEREGAGLRRFADWCADRELATTSGNPRGAHSSQDEESERAELCEFFMWLQYQCDLQLASAQRRATEAGMSIGLMADLAVGVHPDGADAHTNAAWLAPEASVGAPPDGYNQQGQDWSQPPWHPQRLAEAGYRPWRNLLQAVLRHAGGIRIDHILGLFRLYWIPRGESPRSGTYVNYDWQALVGILALEAERAGAVVIGEDLGTFEPWVQDALAHRGIMGTSILWFESQDDAPRRQENYRRLALSSLGTHDLPPTAGYLEGEHIALRERLGVLDTSAEEEERADAHWQGRVLDAAREAGCFGEDEPPFTPRGRSERGSAERLILGLSRYVAGTPSALTATSLVDMVGDRRPQNQPGTTKEKYPNWCIPLTDGHGTPVLVEDLREHPMFRAVAEASRR